MLFVIITVREEVFPESRCWALGECTMQALRSAGWLSEPSVQKVVRLPPAEFTYHPGAEPSASAADAPNFILVERLLSRAKPVAEKEAFWAEFRAGVEARLCSIEPDIAIRFAEMPGENVYFPSQGALALMAPRTIALAFYVVAAVHSYEYVLPQQIALPKTAGIRRNFRDVLPRDR